MESKLRRKHISIRRKVCIIILPCILAKFKSIQLKLLSSISDGIENTIETKLYVQIVKKCPQFNFMVFVMLYRVYFWLCWFKFLTKAEKPYTKHKKKYFKYLNLKKENIWTLSLSFDSSKAPNTYLDFHIRRITVDLTKKINKFMGKCVKIIIF